MTVTGVSRAMIRLWPTHRVTLEPSVPEIFERLLRLVKTFEAGGPLGHRMSSKLTAPFAEPVRMHLCEPSGKVRLLEGQFVPQGLIPVVAGWLEELGYAVEVRDTREDSPRWAREREWRKKVRKSLHKVLAAVEREKALRVVCGSTDVIADTIAAAARAYPAAAIEVAVPTYELLRRIWGRLRWQLKDETLGLYTSKQKKPGRVSVGVIGQLPRSNKGECDLLVLPFAAKTLGERALEVVFSGRYRRLLSFTPFRDTRDENVTRRLHAVAGSVFPPEKPKVPVTAVVLSTHGTRPAAKFEDALDEKMRLYWLNARRNNRVADVAKRLVKGTKKSVRSLFPDRELVELTVEAAKTGIAVLVETPVHARELAKLLPGWVVWVGNDLTVPKPQDGCGVICTELAANETSISAGVLIRATGTKWPLPEIDWPWVGDVEHGVLVDFRDEYHLKASQNAECRMESYRKSGMPVWVENRTEKAANK